jgi:hypothetical protein
MKIAVVTGTRRDTMAGAITRALDAWEPDVVLVGDATGVDAEAREWTRVCGAQLVVFSANWRVHGKAAGPKRNAALADAAEAYARGPYVVQGFAVPDAESRGTHDCVAALMTRGVSVQVVHGNAPPRFQPGAIYRRWQNPRNPPRGL